MTLTILTDAQIQALLEELTPEELIEFQQNLRAALHEYSTGTQTKDDSVAVHQPGRTSIYSAATMATTLFMPSASSIGSGIKGSISASPIASTYATYPCRADRGSRR